MTALHDLVERAIGAGALPPEARAAVNEKSTAPPWAIALVGFIGAQFAVWPLLLFLGFVRKGAVLAGLGPYVTGLLLVGGCWAVLRARNTLGFVSHMAFTVLLVGDGLLVFGRGRDLAESDLLASTLVAALQVTLALALRLRWAQTVLGALAFGFWMLLPTALVMWRTTQVGMTDYQSVFFALAVLGWAAVVTTEPRWSARPYALSLWAIAAGWGATVLLFLYFQSGGMLGVGLMLGSVLRIGGVFIHPGVAVLVVLASGAALHWHWRGSLSPAGRSLLLLGFAALAVMVWFMPRTALTVVMLAASLASGRRRMAGFALLVLLSSLSAFYYYLTMTLAHKAFLVMATGAVLLLGVWLVSRLSQAPQVQPAARSGTPAQTWPLAVPLMLVGGVLALGAANYHIWQKERVISQGQKIYVALAPRDPRSLMQGDYMALNFGMPREVVEALGGESNRWQRSEAGSVSASRRNTVVAQLDARGVASVLRVARPHEALAAGELLLPVQLKGGRWALVTDAFFFPEGAGKPLEAAKFGELRALGDGQALLVGLADERLVSLTEKSAASISKER